MICVNCGKEISDNSQFCGFCGTPVAAAAAPAPEPVPVMEAAPAAEPAPAPEPVMESAPTPVQPTGFMPGQAAVPPTPMQGQTAVPPMQAQFTQQTGFVPGQNPAAIPPTPMQTQPMQAQPAGAIPPAVPPAAGGEKKKGKAGIIVLIIILVLLLAGGGVLAFLFLNRPIGKINKALEAGDITTAVELYENLSNDKDKAEVSERLLIYAEEARDNYLSEDIDYEEALDILSLLADARLETDDEIDSILAFVNRIYASRESYAAAEAYRANGEYAMALESYDDVIADDTRYYDKAQTAIEEVKKELISSTIDEAYALMNSGDYQAAMDLLTEVNLSIPGGGSSELTDAYLTVQAAAQDNIIHDVIEDANIAIAEGRYSEAREMLEDALAAYPDNADLQNAIAGLVSDGALVGTWVLEYDIQSMIVEELGEDFADFESPLVIPIMFEFNEDGTFRMYLGGDLRQNFDDWLDDFVEYTADYIYGMFEAEGLGRTEIDYLIEGVYGSSLEDYLRATLYEEMGSALEDLEDLGDMEETAYYEVQGDRIYMSDYNYDIIGNNDYVLFEIYGDTLILTEEGSAGQEIIEGLSYPLTFKRVANNY